MATINFVKETSGASVTVDGVKGPSIVGDVLLEPIPGLGFEVIVDGKGQLYKLAGNTYQANGVTLASDAVVIVNALRDGVFLKTASTSLPISILKDKSSKLSNSSAAVNATPIISLNTSVPAGTPTYLASWPSLVTGANTNKFNFGGGVYRVGGITSPVWGYARTIDLPQVPTGYGNAFVDFDSDAPLITIPYKRDQQGAFKVILDGIEVLRVTPAQRTGTAQAGAANSITLDAGASATNGMYFNMWIRITGGTGVGQVRLISAYVGSTKIATVSSNWTTNPDATSTFAITYTKSAYTNSDNASAVNYFLFDYSGERRMRKYRVEYSGSHFPGVYVANSIDTVIPSVKTSNTKCLWFGTSHSAGTGADAAFSSMANICCNLLGWELNNLAVGGTGYLNAGSGLTFLDRIVPPTNAWLIKTLGATAGTYTITQNGITATIGYADNASTIQSTLNTAFGAGKFYVTSDGATWIIGKGTNADYSGAMTANFSGLTMFSNTAASIVRYTGDIPIYAPKDANGNFLPFVLVIEGGTNDTISTNGTFTPTLLQSTVTTILNYIKTNFPTAITFIVGNIYLKSGSLDVNATNANNAIIAACTAALPKINNIVPFIDTLTTPWTTGTGSVGNLKGDGNSDVCCSSDGTHASNTGHYLYGSRIAQTIESIINR
jgi:hypothetical protein